MEEKKYIQSLLDKFLEGNTTETEERLLSDYFSSDNDIPAEWQEYVIFFRGFKNYKPVTQSKSHKRIWLSAAASIAILIGIGITLYPKLDSETIEPNQKPTIAKVERSIAHQPKSKDEAKTDVIQKRNPKPSVKAPKAQAIQTINMVEEEYTEDKGYDPSAAEFDDYSTDEFICINLDKMKHESNETRSAMASMNNELLSLE